MAEQKVSYEEYIPTDKFTLQDMYFWALHRLLQDYGRIMRAWYNNRGKDTRAMIEFYANADGLYWFAWENIQRFLDASDKKFLHEVFGPANQIANINDVDQARQVFQALMRFASKSKLTDLSESRPMGDFAYARARLGLALKPKE